MAVRTLRVNLGEEPREQTALFSEESAFKNTIVHIPDTSHRPWNPSLKQFGLCSIQLAHELQAFALLWYLSRQSLKALFKHKSVQPHNLSERFCQGIVGSLPSLPQGQPFGRWEAGGRRQRLFNTHLTRHLDSSQGEGATWDQLFLGHLLRHGIREIPGYLPLPFWLWCFPCLPE